MYHTQFALLGTRRFLPLFLTQFLGALNDNLFKNALVILMTYVLADQAGLNAQIMVTLAAGIFILPFFLFSATAGQLADKFDKTRVIRWVKLNEILVMAGAVIGFYLESVAFLVAVLFLMGTQSAFFGPLKYGSLPDQLHDDELIGGNAWIETATFIAILIGTLLGGLLILREGGIALVSVMVLAVAVAGWLASLYIPPTRAAAAGLRISYNFLAESWRIVSHTAQRREIFLTILGISWFWLVGATFLAQFPNFAKDVLKANEQVVTLFLVAFALGISTGSLFCNRMLKGQVHATYVPLGAFGITVFGIDLFFASQHVPLATAGQWVGAATLLQSFAGWRILIDLFLTAVAGGIYIVPLMAMLQHHSEESHRARNIAGNNIVNSLFMVVAALGSAAMLNGGFSVPSVFLTIALANAAVAVYIVALLPGALVKSLLAWVLELCYRVKIEGMQNYQRAGTRVLIVANHQSYLDAPLLAAYLPDELTFAINTFVAKDRFMKFFISLAKTFPIDPTNPLSMRTLIDVVKRREKVVIFPEGRITVTGSLMKVYEGPGMIADKSGAQILPVRIDGAQYTPFSRLKGKVRLRWFPKIRITVLPPRSFVISPKLKGRARRESAGQQLYDVMTDMIFHSSDHRQTLFASLIDARNTHGASHLAVEDIERAPLGYGRLLAASFALGRALANATGRGEYVGVLAPNMVGTAVTFFALQAFGRVPALLNFSTGTRNVLSSCVAARIRTVYTARRFVENADLGEMIEAIKRSGINVVYLEDMRRRLSAPARIIGYLASKMPRLAYGLTHRKPDPDAPCVVLFTSGTEGTPKGVALSHANIQANRYQVSSCIDFGPTDIVFNALPMFHSFGLTCGTLLPILSGIKTFLYPSPLHYRIIPELIYETNASLMFGTDTFLAGYAKFAHPYDFYSLRYAFTGAEKLKDQTRKVWGERFGIRVFEGYGATETAPVLSLNTPMQHRPGSVGRLVPGIRFRLEKIAGIAQGGQLWVSGPNVMVGYLRADNPGQLSPAQDGWYDTGDIVEVDGEGFLTIKGRAKRFAKIGGEMVSLAAVESFLADLWPDHRHAVVSVPDSNKGEQLVLVTDNPLAERETILEHAKRAGIAELGVPRRIMKLESVPLLGSGKVDYVSVQQIAREHPC